MSSLFCVTEFIKQFSLTANRTTVWALVSRNSNIFIYRYFDVGLLGCNTMQTCRWTNILEEHTASRRLTLPSSPVWQLQILIFHYKHRSFVGRICIHVLCYPSYIVTWVNDCSTVNTIRKPDFHYKLKISKMWYYCSLIFIIISERSAHSP